MTMLWRTVSGQLAWSWAMTAMRSRSGSASTSPRSVPSQYTAPLCGRYRPASTLASVVFPEPFSPTSATTSPWRISTLTSDRAGRAAPG